jgi:hypothetical protein
MAEAERRKRTPKRSRVGAPLGSSDSTTADRDPFLASLMETSLYSMGAFFSDQHPDLVEDVIEQSVAIERRGLSGYAEDNGLTVEACFETLLTGLAVRYYNAVAA